MEGQSKIDSLQESMFKVVIGYFVNTTLSVIIWGSLGHDIALGTAAIGGLMFTATSIFKNYAVRRLFNWLEMRKSMGLPHTIFGIVTAWVRSYWNRRH